MIIKDISLFFYGGQLWVFVLSLMLFYVYIVLCVLCFMIVVCDLVCVLGFDFRFLLGLSGCITSTSSLHLTSQILSFYSITSLHSTPHQLIQSHLTTHINSTHSQPHSLTHSDQQLKNNIQSLSYFFSCAIETTWEGRAILTFIPSQTQQHLTLTFKSWCLYSTAA